MIRLKNIFSFLEKKFGIQRCDYCDKRLKRNYNYFLLKCKNKCTTILDNANHENITKTIRTENYIIKIIDGAKSIWISTYNFSNNFVIPIFDYSKASLEKLDNEINEKTRLYLQINSKE
jgi:hypothetical protein